MTEREIILFQNPATDILIGKQNRREICVKASHSNKNKMYSDGFITFRMTSGLGPTSSSEKHLVRASQCTPLYNAEGPQPGDQNKRRITHPEHLENPEH